MLSGRDAELTFLNHYYSREGSQILVLYGQRGVGKTALLEAFAENRPCYTYTARACSAGEQLYQWGMELREQGKELSRYPHYTEIFLAVFGGQGSEKQILVIENFHHIIKGDETFLPELLRFQQTEAPHGSFVILCTSASGWVENSMVSRIGSLVSAFAGFLKVRELGFEEMCHIFPAYSLDDQMRIYAALGGFPGLWKYLDQTISAKENLIRYLLNADSRLYNELTVYTAEELREPAVYNTILAAMARGSNKLNDIYRHTGFSRAKISVYLKNLMELELVEKVFSGTYCISNSYMKFYFRFLFPHQSMSHQLSSEEFYARYVEQEYPDYMEDAYRKICREQMAKECNTVEEWCWKPGTVYLVGKDKTENTVVAACSYARAFSPEDYDWMLFCMKNAHIKAERYVLYAEKGITPDLQSKMRKKGVQWRSISRID